MTKAEKLIQELSELMEKYDAELTGDADDYEHGILTAYLKNGEGVVVVPLGSTFDKDGGHDD